MAREASVTQEQVNAAADALVAQGLKPTTRAVLESVGSGSMATIVKLLQGWKSKQTRYVTAVDEAIDQDVIRAISQMVGRKVAEAMADGNAKIAELQTDLVALINENERQSAELSQLKEDLIKANDLVQSQAGQIEQLTLDADRTRENLERQTKEREAAQIALAKAELRIESLPGIQEDLKAALLDARKLGEEAAELRGILAGMKTKQKN